MIEKCTDCNNLKAKIEELKAKIEELNSHLGSNHWWECVSLEQENSKLKMRIKDLETFKAEILAGCDIQRGSVLYRQVPVVIGPGITQAEIELKKAKKKLHLLRSGKVWGEWSSGDMPYIWRTDRHEHEMEFDVALEEELEHEM